MLKKNIPAILLAGMFFFSAHGFAGPLELAEDLFRKGEWQLCRRECRRALLEGTEPVDRFELLHVMASVRTGMAPEQAIPLLQSLSTTTSDDQLAAMAFYELGRQQWQLDQIREAFDSFSAAFYQTTDKHLFLHAACSLFLLMEEHPELETRHDALVTQINTSRSEWYGALFSQCGNPAPKGRGSGSPGWFIGFYRTQISPAIGARCTLEPSCSEYFRQAKAKHGFLAFAMIGDRFFREPEVNNQKKASVVMEDGQIRYCDPVEAHTFWMVP